MKTTRRYLSWFLGTSLGALLVAILYPVARYLSPPDVPESTTNRVEAGLTNGAQFLEDGFKIVRFGDEPVIVFRLAADDFRAFSAVCTHLSCIVDFQKDWPRIWCYCHNGWYDITGQVVSGPPPRPLPAYEVDLADNGPGQPETVVITKAS